MHGISAGVAACVVVAVTVGCGSARASHPGSAAHAAAPAKTANPGKTRVATSGRVGAGARSGCRGAAAAGPVGKTFVVTLAGNEKTYCVRVGDTLQVYLRGAGPGRWLRPLVSSIAVVPIPGAARTLAAGVTGASFAAVRPGQVIMTSVRPPCQFAVPLRKGDIEPAFPLPRAYPLRDCAPDRRFSASIIVLR